MSDHYGEPWEASPAGYGVIIHGKGRILHLAKDASAVQEIRRVIACVNACAGIPTEELEQFVAAGGALHFDANLGRLRKQVADLRAVLVKLCDSAIDTIQHRPMFDTKEEGFIGALRDLNGRVSDAHDILAATQPQEVQG